VAKLIPHADKKSTIKRKVVFDKFRTIVVVLQLINLALSVYILTRLG